MNIDQSSASSPTAAGPGPSGNQRKERGAIAAQACETCRTRKQKCDEQRPKCGTCQRFKLVCHYREPQPTKKDKTLVEILDRLKCLEGKIDDLALRDAFPQPPYPPTSVGGPTAMAIDPEHGGSVPLSLPPPDTSSRHLLGSGSMYRYVSAVHKMLAWPAIQQLLEAACPDLAQVNSLFPTQGAIFGVQKRSNAPMPTLLKGVESLAPRGQPAPELQPQVSNTSSGLHVATPLLDWESMTRSSKAYFDSFNMLHPIMDRQFFNDETLNAVLNDGLNESPSSTLACLVFALGEVALAAQDGIPGGAYKGRPSGVKGSSNNQHPGLALFNEARKRMGFNLTECTVENVQIFSLAGLYYESCFRHMDYWRMTAFASLACQALIACDSTELSSARGDLVRRLFWHCSITETFLHLELDLPLTGLNKLQDHVGSPNFNGPSFSQEDYLANEASHFQEHFLSQVALRRLCLEFHCNLANGSFSSVSAHVPLSSATEQPAASMLSTARDMAMNLESWRGMLPDYLRWSEGQAGGFGRPEDEVYGQTMYPAPDIFTADLEQPVVSYPYVADVQVAMLRTRYYHLKHLVHRPFIYKALHHAEAMTHDDAEGVAECLQTMLKWPITMSPTCAHKRLIPCHFLWTQNLLGVLVLLHLTEQVPILARIRSTMCGDRFDVDASETVKLCIDWIRDLKSVDAGAEWCWEIVKGIYRLDDE